MKRFDSQKCNTLLIKVIRTYVDLICTFSLFYFCLFVLYNNLR